MIKECHTWLAARKYVPLGSARAVNGRSANIAGVEYRRPPQFFKIKNIVYE